LEEAAVRYDRYRPKVHSIDSTLPLLQICDAVIGIDSSPEMLRFAEEKGLATRVASYDALDEEGAYDLISTYNFLSLV
jgi:hypothetical protein